MFCVAIPLYPDAEDGGSGRGDDGIWINRAMSGDAGTCINGSCGGGGKENCVGKDGICVSGGSGGELKRSDWGSLLLLRTDGCVISTVDTWLGRKIGSLRISAGELCSCVASRLDMCWYCLSMVGPLAPEFCRSLYSKMSLSSCAEAEST